MTILSKLKHLFGKSQSGSFLWALINQGVLSLGAALIVISLSYFLSPSDFGGIRYLSSVLAVFAFFSLPGVGLVVMKDSHKLTRSGFLHALTTQFKWGLVASFGGILFGFFNLFYAGNADLGTAFVIAGVLAPLANLYLMPGQAFASMQAFKKKALVDTLIISAVLVGASLGAVITKTVAGTTLYYFGVQSLATFVFIVWAYMDMPVGSGGGFLNKTSDVEFGKRLTLVQIPAVLLSSIERIIVYQLLGPLVLAIFVIVSIPVEHAKSALRSFLQFYVLPQIKEGDSVAGLGEWMKLGWILTILSAVALLVVLPFAFPILFPKYASFYKISLLLVVVIIPIPFQIMTLYWMAAKRTFALFQYALGITILNIVIFVPLTTVWGLSGAVGAKVLFEVLAAGLIVLIHSRVKSDHK